MSAGAPWQLEVLGPPRLVGSDGPRRLDRRTAALLAFVALEGPQPRSRAAGLLWPEVREATARANLRQLLKRLREATGAELLDDDPLALAPGLAIDVVALRAALRAGTPAPAGELLDGVELEDAPELATWIAEARAALRRQQLDALIAAAARAEAAADWPAAIAAAQRAVDLDPLSEAAQRQLMRAHYLAGDRAAASAAYARCRAVLRERLGVEPSRMTVELADEIARGKRGLAAPAPVAPRIPITVLRPPVLAGRAREWALLQEAWAAGKSIMLGGPPGVGKSRLMSEFLAVHARAIVASGRPLDRSVPYGTHARTYREMVDAIGGPAVLPPWVVRELARLIPALGESPGPLTSPEERLRFWHAKVEAHRVAVRLGFDTFALDDLQYVDEASAEAGGYVLMQLKGDPALNLQTFHSYRYGELPATTMAIIEAAAAAGLVLHLVLEPLGPEAVGELLASLAVPGLEALTDEILRSTGGNPQLILETVRHLIETGGLDGAAPRIQLGGRVGALLAARLGRLSPDALELARVLAVLGTEFTLERAAAALERAAPDLARAWDELVVAQIVRGEAFAHDLLAEAVIAGTPEPVTRLLHRRAAEVLDDDAGASVRMLSHLLDAGEDELASATRPRALEVARQALLEDEVRRYFGDPGT